MIASAAGLALIFCDSPDFGYKAGSTIGQILGTAALALPVFLIWKFGTKAGRSAIPAKGFNVFSGILVILWLLLFVFAKNMLPAFASGYEDGRNTIHEVR
jgi:uncharacterized membrane protein